MRTAIVGAGFSGLVAAKVLTEFGHDVTVFDRVPDVGGVWSATRRYPGLTTQNDKGSYAFSDFPMPRSYPEWPAGAQVQAYLTDYVARFDLRRTLRLDTEVVHAEPAQDGTGWTLTTRTGDGRTTERFEFLVVANGIFCDPLVPDYEGTAEFRAAGGRLCHSSDVTDLDDVRGRDVVVVGYGKSACDLAGAVCGIATSTRVVARQLLWKIPRRLGGILNYKYLLLTRLGEALFPYQHLRGVERFLHGPCARVPATMLGGVQSLIVRQLGLRRLGLVPHGPLGDIARSTVSLATDGFYRQVADGRILVHRDTDVVRLLVRDGRPAAELTGGDVVPADVVVCATGFHQRVPFLDAAVRDQLTDERGNFELYRQILPLSVPGLAFLGYNSSFFSPLNAEIAALWLVDHLAGTMRLPEPAERRRQVRERVAWMEDRTDGRHARGTNIVPFSMHNIDEMLADLGVDVSWSTRIRQWLLPVDPGAYRVVAARLRRRHGAPASIRRQSDGRG